MRSRAIEEGSDRLESAALRYALAKKGDKPADRDAPEVREALVELEAACLLLLDLHKQETPSPCTPYNPTSVYSASR